MSLALSTLIYEWRRYMAAIIALATAGLLVLAEVGLFMGIGASFNAPITHSRADLIVMGPKATALFSSANVMPRRVVPQLYMHPEVAEIGDIEGSGGLWRNDPNSRSNAGRKADTASRNDFVQTFSVDTRPGAVTLPTDFEPDIRLALEEPYAVAIDTSAQKALGVRLGEKASLNGHTVTVRALLHGYANVANSMVYMSRQTARLIGVGSSSSRVGPLLVRLKHRHEAEQVADQLNARANGQYRAWLPGPLAKADQAEILKKDVVGIMLVGGLVLGAFVGTVITWQTLRGAIFANIKEFASLRALGVSVGSLRLVILELSFWAGVAGLALTALLVWGLSLVADLAGLPLDFPLPWVATTAGLLISVAMVSGVLSMGVLKQSQPADLLR